MPALSLHGGQAPLILTADDPPARSPLLDSHSIPIIQNNAVADENPYEPLRTSTIVEVSNEDSSSQLAQAITIETPSAGTEDDSVLANKDSSRCQQGAVRRYWETLMSIFNRLFLSAPRSDAPAHKVNNFEDESGNPVEHEHARHASLHRYCVLLGLCAESTDYRKPQAEESTSQCDEPEVSIGGSYEERILSTVPDYVLDYAPYVHLYSGEEYWPCDIAEHLLHTTPYLNYTPARAQYDHEKLSTLDDLNKWGHHVYLTSNDNVVGHPEWLTGKTNIPESRPQCNPGDDNDEGPADSCGHKKLGYSDAPAILIVVEKEDGVVDAFWFFFYSFNKGNTVFNVRFGNHIGDWEHTTIRFVDGEPTAVFLSEHDFGDAYTYDTVEKKGKRVSAQIGFQDLMKLLFQVCEVNIDT